jgi:hypothetical protein
MVTLVWSAVACIVLGAILMYAGREPSEDERDVETPLPSCSDGIWDYQHAAPGADFTENGVPYIVGEPETDWVWTAPVEQAREVAHNGATETWSPTEEIAEVTAASNDDIDLFLAELNRKFDALCTWELDAELARFNEGSQQLHAYRELRIGATQEIPRVVE